MAEPTSAGGAPAPVLERPAPPAASGHFPCFDGFRAIAASTIVLTHVSYITTLNRQRLLGPYFARMDIGVSVFFLISGFLLYRPFVVAHLADRPAPATRAYFRRRFLRIIPAYWLVLVFVFFVFHTSTLHGPGDAAIYFGFLQIYSRSHITHGLTQAWSLCTELSFYVFLPLWAVAVRRAGVRTGRRLAVEVAGLVLLVALSWAWRLWVLLTRPGDYGILGTWLPAYLDLFAMGMGLALASAWLARRATDGVGRGRWLPGASWALAGGLFWIVSTRVGLPRDQFAHPLTTAEWLVRHLLYGLVSLCLLLPGVFGPQDRGLVRGLLRNRVVQRVGLVSYGVYLWHELWIDRWYRWHRTPGSPLPFWQGHFGEVLVVVSLATLVSAVVSYHVLERPMLALKNRALPSRRRSA